MTVWVWWVLAAVVFLAAEAITTTLFIGPFSVGALGAMAVSLASGSALLQVAVFLAGSGVAFTIVRPIAKRHRSMPPQIRTGMDALIGSHGFVVEEIRAESGSVKLGGEVWSARPYDEDDVFAKGAKVQVVQIRGAIALVSE
jgi:membrane protein implicated in regulation of membrane protease activity